MAASDSIRLQRGITVEVGGLWIGQVSWGLPYLCSGKTRQIASIRDGSLRKLLSNRNWWFRSSRFANSDLSFSISYALRTKEKCCQASKRLKEKTRTPSPSKLNASCRRSRLISWSFSRLSIYRNYAFPQVAASIPLDKNSNPRHINYLNLTTNQWFTLLLKH